MGGAAIPQIGVPPVFLITSSGFSDRIVVLPRLDIGPGIGHIQLEGVMKEFDNHVRAMDYNGDRMTTSILCITVPCSSTT